MIPAWIADWDRGRPARNEREARTFAAKNPLDADTVPTHCGRDARDPNAGFAWLPRVYYNHELHG